MKFTILAFAFILLASFAKGQLTKSKGQVMQIMANDNKWSFDKIAHTNDSIPFLAYKTAGMEQYKCFYFKNDTCFMIRLIVQNKQLNDIIKDLNSKFTPIEDNTWVDFKERSKYTIVLRDNELVFQVVQTSWK